MNWRLWGPLVFTVLLFVLASSIKLIAFNDTSFYTALAPELSLWSTGVLFSFAVSEYALFGAKPVSNFKRGPSGNLEMQFRVDLPERPEFSPRLVYLFVVSMGIWLLDLLLVGKAEALIKRAGNIGPTEGFLIFGAIVLAGFSVGITLRTVREVS